MLNKFKAARRAGVPIIAIETADPAATINVLRTAYVNPPAIVQWDIVRGLSPVNDLGSAFISKVTSNPALETGNPTEMLQKITEAPEKTIIIMHQANRLIETNDPGLGIPVCQGIWNLRDVFKSKRVTLVLLGTTIILPAILKNDVMVIEEPMPDGEQLRKVVTQCAADAEMKLTDEEADRHVKALLGLSAFSAEQSFATSIYEDGDVRKVDERGLWERKCKTVEQTRGLSIYRGKETYSDIVGYDNAKSFMKAIMNGPDRPEAYIFIDEIEKQLAGFGTDSSGVATEMMGKMLTWWEDRQPLGMLLLGPGGTGKSLLGKATGNEAGKPTVIFDLSSMKGSLVGQSIENLSTAQRVVDGLTGGGRMMIIATCNRFGTLPPELKRRFTMGTFFFDLPTETELSGMWDFYRKKFELGTKGNLPDSDGWTGAEVRNCCNISWRLRCSLEDAAKYVVPVSVSAADEIEKLRTGAEGKFIGATVPGFYKRSKVGSPAGRRFGKGDE